MKARNSKEVNFYFLNDSLIQITNQIKIKYDISKYNSLDEKTYYLVETPTISNCINEIFDMINKDDFLLKNTYADFEKYFFNTINDEPNKAHFVKKQKKLISALINESLIGVNEKSKILNYLSDLIAKEKAEVLKIFYRKYLIEGEYEVFVRICFCFDLVKYKRFLKGDTVTHMLEETTTTKARPKPPKHIKPFQDYFVEKYKYTLPDLCKVVFNARNSQKDYAIMVCLLKVKYLLSFTPTYLYKSWYIFIDRTFREGENFNAITKNYIEREIGECDTYDIDYKNLKKEFEKVLTENNIS